MGSDLDRLRGGESPSVVPDGLSLPSVENAVIVASAVLLFGGLALVALGTTWVVYGVLGLPPAVVGAGATMTAYAGVLVVVLARTGYLSPPDA